MLPLHSPFPHLSYQVQNSTQSPQQQVMAPQSQLGLNNSQVPIPFSNSSMPNVPTSMAPPPGFMTGPNNFYPLQNNHLGTLNGPVPQPGKPHLGFGPQSSVNNINSIPTFPIHGQGFGHSNLSNLPQFNQNVGLTFGQFCMPNHLQSTNQFLPMQIQNLPQFVPQNAFGVLSQAFQATVPQNPAFLGNPQFGTINCNHIQHQSNQNQHIFPLPGIDVNTLKPSPAASRQLQGNSSTNIQPELTINLQPPGFMGTQGNYTSNRKNPSSKNFARNAKRGMPQGGFQKSQCHRTKHGNKMFGFSNAHNGRGPTNEKSGRFAGGNSVNQGREQRR
ncbi:hypothetical protein PanWU01x14_106520 [Parasponia andersonii]|uniref:Uncharacterized protein n=1 Tax=Parasponia andersonii TaxID=3476 RepID=A0A2P5D0P2_PARAD|nr:hypothetical protein PanWU01x14_106520 [Parasponia andersonii]